MLMLAISYLLPIAALSLMFWILFTGDIRKQKDASSFRLFLFNLIIWLSFLYAADLINSHKSLLFLRLALFAGSFAPLTFFVFCQKFSRRSSLFITSLLAIASTLFAIFALTNLLVVSVEHGDIGVKIGQYTSIYQLQTIYTICAFTISLLWLRIKARKAKDPKITNQVRFITYGTIFALIIGVLGGSINASGTNLLSPLAIAIFAASSFFVIFRHGLFDVRLVVTRSIAYVLTLGIITFIFSFLIFGFSGAVLESHFSRPVQRVFYVIVTLILVLTYLPLKRFFDHLTNRIFYRDAYDPQQLLDELNTSLVTTIEIDTLLSLTSRIMVKYLKAEFCSFIIKPKSDDGVRVFGHTFHISSDDLQSIKHVLENQKSKTIFASDLTESNKRYIDVLQKTSIMCVSKLAHRSGLMGYMVLGDKKSGNLYSSQDSRMIEIISDELAIATQNALRFEEIQKFNIALQQKIDEATRELRKTNAKLKALDKAKDEFISMASHQLRTPLTSVKGYLGMILDGDVGTVKKSEKEMIQHAFDASQRMVYLIADLLNVSRMQTGKFAIESQPSYLPDVVEGEVAQLTDQAKNKELTLIYDKPKSFPTLNLDETKIRQVIMNFLDNALYYTPAGGTVTAALGLTDETVSYTVTDTGLGVPKDVQHKLFSKFYRADNARKMRPDGTGLGLFMAKKVVVAQGGAIIFSSQEGQGSTFGFSFPRKDLEVKPTETDENK